MIDTNKYEGHTQGPWWTDEWFNDGVVRFEKGYCVEQRIVTDPPVVDESGEWVCLVDNEADAKLIADAPLLLEEYKRLMHCLRYVGARLFLDANDYRPYDYTKLLEFCMGNTGEPDDMSGEMGMMIEELIHYDEKLEVDKEMSA